MCNDINIFTISLHFIAPQLNFNLLSSFFSKCQIILQQQFYIFDNHLFLGILYSVSQFIVNYLPALLCVLVFYNVFNDIISIVLLDLIWSIPWKVNVRFSLWNVSSNSSPSQSQVNITMFGNKTWITFHDIPYYVFFIIW